MCGCRNRLIQHQSFALRIVGEQPAVPSPIQRGLKLALDLNVRKVFVQNVAEELDRDRVVRLGSKRVHDLLKQLNMTESGIAEQHLAACDISFGQFPATRRNARVSFLQAGKTQ